MKKYLKTVVLVGLLCSVAACRDVVDVPLLQPVVPPPPPPPGPIVLVEGIANPDRGYHLEFIDNPGKKLRTEGDYNWEIEGDTISFFSLSGIRNQFGDDRTVTLYQLYIYLKVWYDRDIPPAGLARIQEVFDHLKDNGYKVILRFAYDENMGENYDTFPWIQRHIEQLRPLLLDNLSLIAVMQSGFIGAWGEWHSSAISNDQDIRNYVVNTMLDIIPEPYGVQVREIRYKNEMTLTNPGNAPRIGVNNDFFTAGLDPIDDMGLPGAYYDQVKNESPFFYMLGEIPYANDPLYGFDQKMNTQKVLAILRDHHYSAFDITQNYELNLTYWKTVKVYPGILDVTKILYDSTYFIKNDAIVNRSVYDFVRDHLGYRLNLKEASWQAAGGNLTYDMTLTNTGFATVINPREVYLVFIDGNGNVAKEIALDDVNPLDWQPFTPGDADYTLQTYPIAGSVSVSGLSGVYKVGLWLPDPLNKYNAPYDIFMAPGDYVTHWTDNSGRYRVNVIDEITL
jgi:hypothetical protein